MPFLTYSTGPAYTCLPFHQKRAHANLDPGLVGCDWLGLFIQSSLRATGGKACLDHLYHPKSQNFQDLQDARLFVSPPLPFCHSNVSLLSFRASVGRDTSRRRCRRYMLLAVDNRVSGHMNQRHFHSSLYESVLTPNKCEYIDQMRRIRQLTTSYASSTNQ